MRTRVCLESLLRRIVHAIAALALMLAMLGALAAPVRAQVSVYFQFGSGMVVLVPSYRANVWYRERRGYIVRTLPYGYVGEPYTYYSGYPAYYPSYVWVRHHRHWRGEHDNGYHRGWYRGRGHDHDHGHGHGHGHGD